MISRNKVNILAIHQPNFFPWLGYFLKARMADTFIFLDDVQIDWEGYARRGRIRKSPYSEALKWLTLPIDNNFKFRKLNEIPGPDNKGKSTILDSIESVYHKSPEFLNTFPVIQELINMPEPFLAGWNAAIIQSLAGKLGIECEFMRASAYNLNFAGGKKLAGLIAAAAAGIYLSGTGYSKYLPGDFFGRNGIVHKIVDSDKAISSLNVNNKYIIKNASILEWLFFLGFDGVMEVLDQLKQEHE